MVRKLAARLRVWREVVWRPWAWVLGSVYGVLNLCQTVEWLVGWRLPNIFPAWPWWLWALGWLILCVAVILEGAYRSVRDRATAIKVRDQKIADLIAAEPRLHVDFDPECKNCFHYGQSAGQSRCLERGSGSGGCSGLPGVDHARAKARQARTPVGRRALRRSPDQPNHPSGALPRHLAARGPKRALLVGGGYFR
jgi:hypothetical protein